MAAFANQRSDGNLQTRPLGFKIANTAEHGIREMHLNLHPDGTPPTERALRECAATVFGSDAEGCRWFERPALSLDQRRPSDLMGTQVGRDLVRAALGRIDFGVYT